jgi:hypothetical protein
MANGNAGRGSISPGGDCGDLPACLAEHLGLGQSVDPDLRLGLRRDAPRDPEPPGRPRAPPAGRHGLGRDIDHD